MNVFTLQFAETKFLRKLKEPHARRISAFADAFQTPLCRQTQSSRTFVLTDEFHLIEPLTKLLRRFVWRKRNGPRISFCSLGMRHNAPVCRITQKKANNIYSSLFVERYIYVFNVQSKYSANSRLSTSEYSAARLFHFYRWRLSVVLFSFIACSKIQLNVNSSLDLSSIQRFTVSQNFFTKLRRKVPNCRINQRCLFLQSVKRYVYYYFIKLAFSVLASNVYSNDVNLFSLYILLYISFFFYYL